MITADNFIEAFLGSRFYMFNGSAYTTSERTWFVYEQLPEEGPGVKKKIGQFKSEKEARDFLTVHKEEYAKWLRTILVVSASTTVPTVSGTVPPSQSSTDALLQRRLRKRKKPSEKSQPETAETSPTPSESGT